MNVLRHHPLPSKRGRIIQCREPQHRVESKGERIHLATVILVATG